MIRKIIFVLALLSISFLVSCASEKSVEFEEIHQEIDYGQASDELIASEDISGADALLADLDLLDLDNLDQELAEFENFT